MFTVDVKQQHDNVIGKRAWKTMYAMLRQIFNEITKVGKKTLRNWLN